MHLALAPEHFDTDALAGCCAPPEHDETTAAILAHLLRAAPELAQVPLESADGGLALHQVAMFGMPLCVQQLLAVCPEAAAVSSRTGSVPLALALEGGHYDAARALVQATGQAARVFEVLCNHQHCGRPMPRLKTLFGPAIKAHLPLPDECWPNVPKRLPGLLALLPDVLKRGNPADARQLVARLTPAADTLLMSMLGALGSSVALPAELVQRIIALACAY